MIPLEGPRFQSSEWGEVRSLELSLKNKVNYKLLVQEIKKIWHLEKVIAVSIILSATLRQFSHKQDHQTTHQLPRDKSPKETRCQNNIYKQTTSPEDRSRHQGPQGWQREKRDLSNNLHRLLKIKYRWNQKTNNDEVLQTYQKSKSAENEKHTSKCPQINSKQIHHREEAYNNGR